MTFRLGRRRTLNQLRAGDIINIKIPFEENTRDYYNGYKPIDIRGRMFTDRFGNSAKTRMVIYIGRDNETMYYLPLTSKTGTSHDMLHQYELKDTFMMPTNNVRETRSFVEVDALRTMRIAKERELPYTGYVTKEDLDNIRHRISNNTLQFNSKRDQRGYIPESMRGTFEEELTGQGYKLTIINDNKTVYEKTETGQQISRTKYGMVHYHVQMTEEQVRKMVSIREGRVIPDPQKSKTETIETVKFKKTVETLSTHQKERKETYASTY